MFRSSAVVTIVLAFGAARPLHGTPTGDPTTPGCDGAFTFRVNAAEGDEVVDSMPSVAVVDEQGSAAGSMIFSWSIAEICPHPSASAGTESVQPLVRRFDSLGVPIGQDAMQGHPLGTG